MSAAGGPREGARGRIDAMLAAIGARATVDADGDWLLETDAGPFLLVLDGDNGDLVALQTIATLEDGPAAVAEDLYMLMRLNVEASGACFAGLKDGELDMLVLCSRVPADEIAEESVARMLADATRLSRRLDEVTAES